MQQRTVRVTYYYKPFPSLTKGHTVLFNNTFINSMDALLNTLNGLMESLDIMLPPSYAEEGFIKDSNGEPIAIDFEHLDLLPIGFFTDKGAKLLFDTQVFDNRFAGKPIEVEFFTDEELKEVLDKEYQLSIEYGARHYKEKDEHTKILTEETEIAFGKILP